MPLPPYYLEVIMTGGVACMVTLLMNGNLSTWTSTYSGTETTTSQLSLASSTPFPIGPKQFVATLSLCAKRRPTSGMH